MDLLAKFIRASQRFTPDDWTTLMQALASGNREKVAAMFGFTMSEADTAFRNVRSLSNSFLN
jgi:hypothetical protein